MNLFWSAASILAFTGNIYDTFSFVGIDSIAINFFFFFFGDGVENIYHFDGHDATTGMQLRMI